MLLRVAKTCNQDCVFCSFDEEKDAKQEPLFELAQREKKGPGLIQISGGEPLLCKPQELISFCETLIKKGKTLEFQTNASLLAQLPFSYVSKLVSLISLSGGYFNINFSACDAETDFKITRLRGAFLKRLKAVKTLKALKASVRLTFVINSLNYKSLEAFAKLACRLKPDLIQFSFVKGQGGAFGKKNIIASYESVSRGLIKAMEILLGKKINFEVDHIPCCYLGRFWRYHVDVAKAISKVDGPHKTEKTWVAQCKGCALKKVCFGPRKDYLKVRKFKKGEIFL